MGRIMAIDYGRKRIGIAVSDPLKMIGSGLTTKGPHEIFEFLDEYFKREKVDSVVLGQPKRLNNQASESSEYVKQFETAFRRKYPEIELVYQDERFTSMLASRALYDGGMKKKDRQKKENIDKMSAAIILQSYLEKLDNLKI